MLRWEAPCGAHRQCVVTARFSPGAAGECVIDLGFAERATNRLGLGYAVVFIPVFVGFGRYRLMSEGAARQALIFAIIGAVFALMAFGLFAITRAVATTEQGLIIDFLKRTVQAA